MSTVRVRHDHNLTEAQARERVDAFESKMVEYGVHMTWHGNTADVKGKGFSGRMELGDGYALIEVKLGLLARAVVAPPRLESAMRKRLDAAFADEPPRVF